MRSVWQEWQRVYWILIRLTAMAENKLGNINNKAQKPELMAPVGSYESLMAAVQGGAGSVYFGIEQLNMRARSSNNFSTADLKKIVKIARKHGLNTYITVNTVVYDAEISLMNQIIDTAKEAGVTAVIATDMATVQYASKQGVEVHASTQLNISNLEAVRFFARYCDVLVLARELTLKQIKNITDTIEAEHITGPSGKKVRIEIFIHGALCMSISGKCYLSLHEQNFSANRGECLQTCRKAYTVTEKESGNQLEIDNEYIMSPKDLWTIHFLNKILDAGVKILKIEGRARSPEYVKTVSRCYREAIDAWYEGAYTEDKIQLWQEQLKTVFNRGFWDGYYLGQRLGEWSHRYGSRATKRRIYLGKGMNYFPKIGVAEFLMETGTLKTGDHVLITGPTTGVIETTVNELRVN
mgnify:FL=1